MPNIFQLPFVSLSLKKCSKCLFFSDVPKTMWLKKHNAAHNSVDKKGQDCSKSTQKSAQGLSKSAQKSAQCLSKSAQKSAQGFSKSEEMRESLRENCKVLVQNQNPFVLPEDSRALAAYYAENTYLPTTLVERSPKRPIGMRSPRRPPGQRKSGKICIYLNVAYDASKLITALCM